MIALLEAIFYYLSVAFVIFFVFDAIEICLKRKGLPLWMPAVLALYGGTLGQALEKLT